MTDQNLTEKVAQLNATADAFSNTQDVTQYKIRELERRVIAIEVWLGEEKRLHWFIVSIATIIVIAALLALATSIFAR